MASLSNSTRGLLSKYRFPPKKKLGQNFIIDQESLDRIVAAGKLSKNDLVVEIGTGLGTLTKELSKQAGKVISIEYDKLLFEITKEILKDYKNIELIRDDFLKLNFELTLAKEKNYKSYKIIANLPYYITAPIITKLIETKPQFSIAVFTVQKEVAERITAEPGTKAYGSLSIFIQFYNDAKIDSSIAKSAFFPAPKITSSIITLTPRKEPLVNLKSEKMFFDIVHAYFEHRRKTLRNAIILSKKFNFSKESLDAALKKCNIQEKRRGETLSIEEFARLSNALS